jgi:hypothetical protein
MNLYSIEINNNESRWAERYVEAPSIGAAIDAALEHENKTYPDEGGQFTVTEALLLSDEVVRAKRKKSGK